MLGNKDKDLCKAKTSDKSVRSDKNGKSLEPHMLQCQSEVVLPGQNGNINESCDQSMTVNSTMDMKQSKRSM